MTLTAEQILYLRHREYPTTLKTKRTAAWLEMVPGLVAEGLVKLVAYPVITQAGEAALAEYAHKKHPGARILTTTDESQWCFECPKCEEGYSVHGPRDEPETTADVMRLCGPDCRGKRGSAERPGHWVPGRTDLSQIQAGHWVDEVAELEVAR